MLQQNPTIKSSNEHALSIEKETKTRDATNVRQNRIDKKDGRKKKTGLSATKRRKAGSKQKQAKPKKATYNYHP
jgi:hypothetical protein